MGKVMIGEALTLPRLKITTQRPLGAYLQCSSLTK